jgi:hypothetical protein
VHVSGVFVSLTFPNLTYCTLPRLLVDELRRMFEPGWQSFTGPARWYYASGRSVCCVRLVALGAGSTNA